MKAVKVFTTGAGAEDAGYQLTTKFEVWIEEMAEADKIVRIEGIHSNSNKFGWMLVIEYATASNAVWANN